MCREAILVTMGRKTNAARDSHPSRMIRETLQLAFPPLRAASRR